MNRLCRGLLPVLCSLACFMFCGCGYTTRGFSYAEKTIHIAPVKNNISVTNEDRSYLLGRTYPMLIEKDVTNILINKFNASGHLKAVSDKEGALSLVCEITDYVKDQLRYTEHDEVEEERLLLSVHIVLDDSAKKNVIDRVIVGETTYALSGPRQKNEASARNDLIDDTVRRIFEAVAEEW